MSCEMCSASRITERVEVAVKRSLYFTGRSVEVLWCTHTRPVGWGFSGLGLPRLPNASGKVRANDLIAGEASSHSWPSCFKFVSEAH